MPNSFTYALPYSDQLHLLYKSLSNLPGFVLLESSDRDRGRYDIVSAYPYDRLLIDSDNKQDAFERLQAKLLLNQSTLDLPFQGGAIGYMAYDLGSSLANIVSRPQPMLQDLPYMDMGFYDWGIIADHKTQQVTLYARNERPEIGDIIQEVLDLWKTPSVETGNFSISSDFKAIMDKQDYQQGFSAIHADLKRGRCYQVNFTQPFQAEYEGDTWEIYRRITANNPVPFAAFLRGEKADVLSFSPERFLSMDNRLLLTSPIKGTIRSSNCPIEDAYLQEQLKQCIKNRAENVMIVDLLRNDLGKISKPGSVLVSALCELQSYRGLHHLVSDIQSNCLDNISFVQAFKACFPGGSITGTPKLESMRVINEQEIFGRGIYCGCIGYFSSHGRFDSNIAIRTITAKANRLHLAAGGAIVMDSNWKDEYEECFIKIAAILRAVIA